VIAFGPASTHAWLELWSGEVANIALVVIAVGSILIRRPFTLAYAKEQSDPSEWSDPHFLRANYVITAVWALAFFIEAASGFYGDAVLHDSNNIWTGWIIQTFPLIVAIQFTLWYPQRLEALAAGTDAADGSTSTFVGSVTPWIAIVGVITLFLGDGPTWLGVALVIAGVGLTRLAHSRPAAPGAA
jgi:hypothetical protein